MRYLVYFFIAGALLAQQEFVGPFSSWTVLRSQGGSSDDTDAMQSALSKLGTPPNSPVLFLRAGTYHISRTLVLTARAGVAIVGEDPGRVRIQWTGPAGGTVLRLNGVARSEIDRIAFDGGGAASALVDQSWDGHTGFFDTGNQYADDVFTGGDTGILGGNQGHGFAETSVIRGSFIRLGRGIALKNFNALDLWVWDSLFDHCGAGISNSPGAGNWRVYNSKFLYSSIADNYLGNTGAFSFIGNYSTGPAPFVVALGSNNPAPMTIQANRINPSRNTTMAPVMIGNQGPVVLLDNQIGGAAGASPALAAIQRSDTSVISVGNRFASTTGLMVSGRVTSLDDRKGQSLRFMEPALPGVPPNRNRQVYEVKAGASSDQIQDVINRAAKSGGTRAVVHLPYGTYTSVSVSVPASDLQIIGDGMGSTEIQGAIQLLGPASHVSLQDLSISGVNNSGDGISIRGTNQPNARVLLDQVHAGPSAVNVLLDGADNLTVEARDFDQKAATGTSIRIAGKGKVNLFDGASYGNATSFQVSGGTLLVRDLWYDGGGSVFLNASGASTVTIAGSMVTLPDRTAAPAFALSGLSGRVTLLGDQQSGQIAVEGASTGAILGAGLVNRLRDYFSNRAAAPAAMVNSKQVSVSVIRTGGSFDLPDQGSCDGPFLRAGTAQTRGALPGVIGALPDSVTDVRLYRVAVYSFGTGIHILP